MLYARDAADGGVRATVTDGLKDWVLNIVSPAKHPLAEIADAIRGAIPGARIEVPDVEGLAGTLRDAGVHFRSDVIDGVGGKQVLLDDPSGNPVELFEPKLREAKLA